MTLSARPPLADSCALTTDRPSTSVERGEIYEAAKERERRTHTLTIRESITHLFPLPILRQFFFPLRVASAGRGRIPTSVSPRLLWLLFSLVLVLLVGLGGVTPPRASATVGDVTLDQSVGGTTTLGTVTMQKIQDSANSGYFVDPAATGDSLVLAGTATASGNLTVGNGSAVRAAFGPLALQYKSGLNSWATGLTIQDTTGNVGIGTTGPSNLLHLNKAGVNQLRIDSSSSGGFAGLDLRTNTSGTERTAFFDLDNTNYRIRLGLGGGEVFSVLSTGNVGIGTTGPGAKLEVAGDILFGSTTNTGRIKSDGTNTYVDAIPAGGADIFRTGGAVEAMRITSAGNVGIGTTSPTSKLHVEGAVTGKALTILNETGDQNILVASASGTNRFVITNAGNVGIGTTGPITKLQVNSAAGGDAGGIGIWVTDANAVASLTFRQNAEAMDASIRWNQTGGVSRLGFLLDDSTASGVDTNERLTIREDGNVGIGTTNPTEKLVLGDLSTADLSFYQYTSALATGNVMQYIQLGEAGVTGEYFLGMLSNANTAGDNEFLFQTNGTAVADGSWTGGGADVAEWTPTREKAILEPGDVLIADDKSTSSASFVRKSGGIPYDRRLIGIVSTNPGLVAGGEAAESTHENDVLVALAGRVPVKIDPESPAIAVGDFLTSSTKPGLAQKAMRPGYVVARALESWSPGGPDRIEAFIQLTYYMGDIDSRGDFRSLEVDTLKVNKTLEVGGVSVMDEINDLKRRLDALEERIK